MKKRFQDFEEKVVIGFDTSCDETSVAVLRGRKVLSNIVSSQVELHKKWGGVVPDVARRAHEENIGGAFKESLRRAEISLSDIDLVAVTVGPGLAIDLEVGIDFAKELAVSNSIPLAPVNHMEGHLLSPLLLNSKGKGAFTGEIEDLFPILAILTSGKHTEIIYSEELGKCSKIGKTLDDAAGEAFDKVGRMLGFGYPGGPIVSDFAKKASGKISHLGLPIPMERSGDLNFSYSGLKTACLYKLKELRATGIKDSDFVYDFCSQFVDSVVRSIEIKLLSAIKQYPDVKTVLGGGGVFNNEKLVRTLGNSVRAKGVNFYVPDKKYRSDNAAMIAIAGLRQMYSDELLHEVADISKVERDPRFSL